jgi:hypothetical protein
MQFPTVVLYEAPYRMEIQQTASTHSSTAESGFNLRRYFNPAIHNQLWMTETPTVDAALKSSPYNEVQNMHLANMNPLTFGWSSHRSDLIVSCTNATE